MSPPTAAAPPTAATPSVIGIGSSATDTTDARRCSRSFDDTPLQNPALMEYADAHMRDGDVVINTWPKTGQTLLQMLLWSVKTNGDTDGCLYLASPWVEKLWFHVSEGGGDDDESGRRLRLNTLEEQTRIYESAPSPRVFKQHVTWDQVAMPPPSSNVSVRYLTVTRHLEDVPYSMYRHLQSYSVEAHSVFMGGVKGRKRQDQTFDEFFDWWIDVEDMWEFYRGMWEWAEDGRVKIVRFEDVVSDPGGAARDLIAHLRWEEPADMGRVVSRVQKSYMTDVRLFGSGQIFMKPFVRSGSVEEAVGRNRGQLCVEQQRRLRARCERELSPRLVKHLYREE